MLLFARVFVETRDLCWCTRVCLSKFQLLHELALEDVGAFLWSLVDVGAFGRCRCMFIRHCSSTWIDGVLGAHAWMVWWMGLLAYVGAWVAGAYC